MRMPLPSQERFSRVRISAICEWSVDESEVDVYKRQVHVRGHAAWARRLSLPAHEPHHVHGARLCRGHALRHRARRRACLVKPSHEIDEVALHLFERRGQGVRLAKAGDGPRAGGFARTRYGRTKIGGCRREGGAAPAGIRHARACGVLGRRAESLSLIHISMTN